VATASVCDKLQHGAMYSGKILQSDPCRACVTQGVIIGKKNVLF